MEVRPEPKILRINTNAALQGQRAQVATFEIFNLLPEGDPFLNQPCQPFDFANQPINPIYLANSLFETMFKNKGIGLTANQVGLPHAVFVIGTDKDTKQIFFNPKVVAQSEETVRIQEGCLSFPELYFKVERPKWVEIEFQHVNGELRKQTFHGMTARVIMHEYDHILGKTFVDLVGKTSMMIAKEKRAKLRKKKARQK